MLYKSFVEKTCFPLPIVRGGDFTSSGLTVTLTGTNVSIEAGEWIYSASLNEVRRVREVLQNEQVTLESPFSTDIAVAEALYVADSSVVYSKVSVSNYGLANGFLNGQTFPKKYVQNIEEPGAVFTIDATGTFISILATQ